MFGAACLVAALIMLAGGDTKPTPNTNQRWYLVYWAGCILLAATAMVTAILDLGAVRREARREQRELLEKAFREIENKRKRSAAGGTPSTDERLRD